MSWYPRHQRIHFINPIAESLLQLIPQDSCLSLDSTNTDLREAICRVITFWRRDQHQLNTRQVARLTRSIKLNNDRSLSALTRILLNTKLVINAVKNELAWSDAPFLSTTVAPKHPVELFRHLTHKIGNTSSLSRPKKPQSMPISDNSPSSREECACARPFDATQLRHQLLYTACPVNSCSAICLALGSGGRFATLGTMRSSPSSASSRNWIVCFSWIFWIWILWSYRFGPGRQLPEERLSESSDSGIASVLCPLGLCRCCTCCSLCTQLCDRGIVNLSSPS